MLFSCYLQIFHSFIGHLRCFVANLLVLIFLGLFCICAILIAFSISGYQHPSVTKIFTKKKDLTAVFKLCIRLNMSQVHGVQGTRGEARNPPCLGRYLKGPRRTQGCRTGLKALAGQGSLVQPWLTPNNGFKNHLSMPQASPDYSISLSMETISLTNGKLKYIKQ